MNGARLKQLRTARGWTQAELAQAVPCSTGAISHFEQGRIKRPSTAIRYRLAQLLAVEESELTGRSAPTPSTGAHPQEDALAA